MLFSPAKLNYWRNKILDTAKNETMTESTKISLKVFATLNHENKCRTDINTIELRSKSDDIIVKELLDVQAATIGSKKLDNVLDTNSNVKHNQHSSAEHLSSELSNLGDRTSTLNKRRGNLGGDKGNLNQ